MNRIKQLRNENGITQEQLAEILNVRRPAISKYENGDIPLTDDTIKLLSEYFGVTADYLLGLSDDKPAQQKSTSGEAQLSEIEFALMGEVRELDDEDKAELLRDAQRLREIKELRKLKEKS